MDQQPKSEGENGRDFDSCRFDFRIDSKNGLTPSYRKRADRRNERPCTLFKCKLCDSLFHTRSALLNHKMEHKFNEQQCTHCDLRFTKKSDMRDHVNTCHDWTIGAKSPKRARGRGINSKSTKVNEKQIGNNLRPLIPPVNPFPAPKHNKGADKDGGIDLEETVASVAASVISEANSCESPVDQMLSYRSSQFSDTTMIQSLQPGSGNGQPALITNSPQQLAAADAEQTGAQSVPNTPMSIQGEPNAVSGANAVQGYICINLPMMVSPPGGNGPSTTVLQPQLVPFTGALPPGAIPAAYSAAIQQQLQQVQTPQPEDIKGVTQNTPEPPAQPVLPVQTQDTAIPKNNTPPASDNAPPLIRVPGDDLEPGEIRPRNTGTGQVHKTPPERESLKQTVQPTDEISVLNAQTSVPSQPEVQQPELVSKITETQTKELLTESVSCPSNTTAYINVPITPNSGQGAIFNIPLTNSGGGQNAVINLPLTQGDLISGSQQQLCNQMSVNASNASSLVTPGQLTLADLVGQPSVTSFAATADPTTTTCPSSLNTSPMNASPAQQSYQLFPIHNSQTFSFNGINQQSLQNILQPSPTGYANVMTTPSPSTSQQMSMNSFQQVFVPARNLAGSNGFNTSAMLFQPVNSTDTPHVAEENISSAQTSSNMHFQQVNPSSENEAINLAIPTNVSQVISAEKRNARPSYRHPPPLLHLNELTNLPQQEQPQDLSSKKSATPEFTSPVKEKTENTSKKVKESLKRKMANTRARKEEMEKLLLERQNQRFFQTNNVMTDDKIAMQKYQTSNTITDHKIALQKYQTNNTITDDKIAMQKTYGKSSKPATKIGSAAPIRNVPAPQSIDEKKRDASSTGTIGVKKSKRGIDNMVAKLWQTKMNVPDTHEKIKNDKQNEQINKTFKQNISNKVGLAQEVKDFVKCASSSNLKEKIISDIRIQKKGDFLFQDQPSKARRRRKGDSGIFKKFHACRVCKQLFDSQDALSEHRTTYKGHCKSYRCIECDFIGLSESDIVQHTEKNHPQEVEAYSSQIDNASIEDDEVTEEGQGFICGECGQCLNSKRELQVHMNTEHRNIPPQFFCKFPSCNAQFSSDDDLKEHLMLHQLNDDSDKANRKEHDVQSAADTIKSRIMYKDMRSSLKKNNVYTCDLPGCSRVFSEYYQLEIHMLYHNKEQDLSCELCDYACRHRNSLNWHMKAKHNLTKKRVDGNLTVYIDKEGKIVCGYGKNQTFVDTSDSAMSSSPASPESFIAEPLDMSVKSSSPHSMFSSLTDADSVGGVLVLNNEPTTVSVAAGMKIDQDFTGLNKNMSVQETPSFTTPVMSLISPSCKVANQRFEVNCQICNTTFENAELMWEHRLSKHEGDNVFYCDTCGHSCESKADLQCHMLATHGKEMGEFRDFLCIICQKGYSSKTGLNHHLMKHTEDGAPRFSCPYTDCHSKLHSKGALKNHVRRVHLKIQPRYICPQDECQRRFHSASSMRAHQVVHSEQRHLVCDYAGCDKAFRETKHLKVHRMQHTDERPLKCLLCEYSCRQRNSMNWHMKSKHGMQKQVTPDGRTIYA